MTVMPEPVLQTVAFIRLLRNEGNTCTARKRDWSVIPDTEGDGTDALIYKGSLKAAGEIIKGTATTTDSWQTCTFTAE